MTMPPAAHPDPERLAALAGEDADARADRALVEHVASCAACNGQVQAMSRLRIALAQLPDLAPSRPFQLVPPVPASAPSSWRVAFRRAFAPVAVAGIVLVLVGGVGATGALGPADAQRLLVLPFQQAASAPDPAQPEITTDDEGQASGEATDDAGRPAAASAPPADNGAAESLHETPEPSTEVGGQGFEVPATRDEDLDAQSTPTSGWVAVLAVGIGLLAVAVVFRAAASNRAPAGR
jgi:hypothetical protein